MKVSLVIIFNLCLFLGACASQKETETNPVTKVEANTETVEQTATNEPEIISVPDRPENPKENIAPGPSGMRELPPEELYKFVN